MERRIMKASKRQETMWDVLSGSRVLVGVGVMGIAAFLMASVPRAAEPAIGETALEGPAFEVNVQIAQTDEELEELEDELDEIEDDYDDEMDEIEDDLEDELDEIEDEYDE